MTDKLPAGNTGRHDLAGSADYFPGKNCCQRCGLWVSDIGKHINEKYCAGLGVAAPKEDSILWDRLRTDLANLGAAYGELPVTAPSVEIFAQMSKLDEQFWHDVAQITGVTDVMLGTTSSGTGKFDIAFERTEPVSESDLNLYYDGIILAARKKREAQYGHFGTGRDSVVCGSTQPKTDENERIATRLSTALNRPLSFPKRIGWKPGDCE